MIKSQLILVFLIASCLFLGCKSTDGVEDAVKLSKIEALDCQEIKAFPYLFSYKTEELYQHLQGKRKHVLTDSEQQELFDNNQTMFFGGERIFPLGKISFEKATLVIYLVQATPDGEYPNEGDSIVLVMYDEQEKPRDSVSISLMDPFSTREINLLSATDFEVTDTDDEYSPDAESEARDIANGYEPETIVTTSRYQIDVLQLKFKQVN